MNQSYVKKYELYYESGRVERDNRNEAAKSQLEDANVYLRRK